MTIHRWVGIFQHQLDRNPAILELPKKRRLYQQAEKTLTSQGELVADPQGLATYTTSLTSPILQNLRGQTVMDTSQRALLSPLGVQTRAVTTLVAETQQDPANQTQQLVDSQNLVPIKTPWIPTLIGPYIPGISERLRSLSSRCGIHNWLSFGGKLKESLSQSKDKLHSSKSQNAIYSVACRCGTLYIGETGRNLRADFCKGQGRRGQPRFSKLSCCASVIVHFN